MKQLAFSARWSLMQYPQSAVRALPQFGALVSGIIIVTQSVERSFFRAPVGFKTLWKNSNSFDSS
jgi:hypothetical protein